MKTFRLLTIVSVLSAASLFTAADAAPSRIDGAGPYFGLVPGNTFDTSGCVAIAVSSRGYATAALKIGSDRAVLIGTIDSTTKQFTERFHLGDTHSLTFTLVSGAGELTRADGSVTVDGNSVAVSAPLIVKHPAGANVPAVGKFTAVLDGPIGAAALDTTAGVARLRVLPNGLLKVDPRMADHRVLPFVATIVSDGTARFWRPIGRDGALMGTLQFTNDPAAAADVTGSVQWFKPANSDAKYYPEAFNTTLTLEGSRYENRAPILDFRASAGVGTLTVDLSEYATTPIVVDGTLDNQNQFTIAGDGSVRLNFNRGVGLAMGSATDANSVRGVLSGVVLQKQNVARGIVFGSAATGEFELKAK